MRQISILIYSFVVLIGCAANTRTSESIVFADRFMESLDQPRLIVGMDLSTNYCSSLDKYGEKRFGKDTNDPIKYLALKPGAGLGVGFATENLSIAVSAQMFMFGADATVKIVENTFLTSYVTSNLSYGFSSLYKIDTDMAIGPFIKNDRFEGIGQGFPFSERRKEKDFSAKSFGIKAHLHTSGARAEQLYFGGIGYSPRLKAFSVFFGADGVRIF